MQRVCEQSRLIVVWFGAHRFQIFRFEDLSAIQTLQVVDPVTSCDDRRSLMLTGGCHTSAW